MKKRLVVFSGSGISAESGLKTFRDSGGLWEKYDITEVATPEAFERNPELVLDFYNQRRKQAAEAQPNAGHLAIAELEEHFNTWVVTQNVDDLHERAGSSQVVHLHGEIRKVRSCDHPELIYDYGGKAIKLGDLCERGGQLRPHIVWFGEMVPEMERGWQIAAQADILLVVGTSLQVYPAAGLVQACRHDIPKYLVDPGEFEAYHTSNLKHIQEKASSGLPKLAKKLIAEYSR